MNESPSHAPRRDWVFIVIVGAVAILFSYWGVYSLVAPVTVFDSQVYNLARLLIAAQGGLFGNDGWNSERQVIFPWSFDAVHYPFLAFGGWGVALPSFACFAAIACVVFRVVRASHGRRTAWWCVLTLFSLPTLMYQASSTKNDLGVIFGLACWYYAYWLWKQAPARPHLWWMALALGFAAGAKSSGVPLAVLLGAFSAWHVCRTRAAALEFGIALVLAALLFGSVETYFNNRRVYGHWLGPPNFIREHQNRDGIRGAAANIVRYVVANQSIGIDIARQRSPFALVLERTTRAVLAFSGLRNVGYRSDFNDETFVCLKQNMEAAGDFGPVGGLAILTAPLLVVGGSRRRSVRGLAFFGLLSLALTATTIAWMPWNTRFLILPFILCSLALTMQILEWCGARRLPSLAWLGILLFSASAYPWYSYNKKPSDVRDAFVHRRRLEMKERATMAEVVDRVENLGHAAPGRPIVLVCAGVDSWTLPLFRLQSVRCVPAPKPDPATLRAITARQSEPCYLLVLNHANLPELESQLEWIQTFGERDSQLYRVRPDASTSATL